MINRKKQNLKAISKYKTNKKPRQSSHTSCTKGREAYLAVIFTGESERKQGQNDNEHLDWGPSSSAVCSGAGDHRTSADKRAHRLRPGESTQGRVTMCQKDVQDGEMPCWAGERSFMKEEEISQALLRSEQTLRVRKSKAFCSSTSTQVKLSSA